MKDATHVHISTGNLYKVLMEANVNATKEGFVPTTVYVNKEGEIYSRDTSIFNKKFRKVTDLDAVKAALAVLRRKLINIVPHSRPAGMLSSLSDVEEAVEKIK